MTPEGMALTEDVDGRIHALAVRGELDLCERMLCDGRKGALR